jgi:HSP20 family molecular chaperone IbpA
MIRPRRCDHRHLETEDALTVVVEMPGVEKGNVDISVKDRVLTIDGRLDLQKYGMQAVYTEYNIGNFHRRFSLSNRVDASNIRAEMRDGLLTLTIRKAEEARVLLARGRLRGERSSQRASFHAACFFSRRLLLLAPF